MKVNLIRISRFITFLKPISIILFFSPLPFIKYIPDLAVTIWGSFFMGLYLLLVFAIKRYEIIGLFNIDSSLISIEINKVKEKIIYDKKVNITFIYSGYRGQPAKRTGTPYLNLAFEDGVGKIILEYNNQKIVYNFLLQSKEELIKLNKIKELCQNPNLTITLILD